MLSEQAMDVGTRGSRLRRRAARKAQARVASGPAAPDA
jgi:hypothetical protein